MACTPTKKALRGRRGGCAGKSSDDLLAVEAAVFDENFAGVISADHDTGEINSRHITFVRLRIDGRLIGLRVEVDPELAQEREIRMITRKRENLDCRELLPALGSFD